MPRRIKTLNRFLSVQVMFCCHMSYRKMFSFWISESGTRDRDPIDIQWSAGAGLCQLQWTHFCASLLNSLVNDIMLVAWNHPWWEYLHHWSSVNATNYDLSLLRDQVVKCYRHSPVYTYYMCSMLSLWQNHLVYAV